MSGRNSPTTDLARALHDQRCYSLLPSCYPGHVALWKAHARTVLDAADPIGALHSIVCDAEIDTYISAGCPERDRHVSFLCAWLARQGICVSRPAELSLLGGAA